MVAQVPLLFYELYVSEAMCFPVGQRTYLTFISSAMSRQREACTSWARSMRKGLQRFWLFRLSRRYMTVADKGSTRARMIAASCKYS